MISIDWTLGASALIFLITLIGLNRLLLRPLYEVLEQRKAATSDVLGKAGEGPDLYESKVQEYENRLKSGRQAGYQEAEALRNESLQQKQSKVSETRSVAERLVAESRRRLEQELNQAREQLQREAHEIALDISDKVLSR